MLNSVQIISEIGVNHNGNINIAKKIISNLKNIDLDFIKIQTYITDNIVKKKTKLANYQKKNLRKINNQYDLLKKYELSFEQIEILKNYIEINKKRFLTSVFDIESLMFIYDIGCKIIKIPSGEMNNYQLLELASKMKLDLIISTGMAEYKDIKKTYNFLKKIKTPDKKISFLHCVSDYPTNIKDLNLRYIKTLRDKFLKNKIGFSDHSLDEFSSMIAVSQGANIIEKHVTLDRSMEGPDHKSSIDVKNFNNYVKNIRNVELMLGKKYKTLNVSEQKNSLIVKKSIYASKSIKKGEYFNQDNITLKRPMLGLPADMWFKILGKRAKKSYLADETIEE